MLSILKIPLGRSTEDSRILLIAITVDDWFCGSIRWSEAVLIRTQLKVGVVAAVGKSIIIRSTSVSHISRHYLFVEGRVPSLVMQLRADGVSPTFHSTWFVLLTGGMQLENVMAPRLRMETFRMVGRAVIKLDGDKILRDGAMKIRTHHKSLCLRTFGITPSAGHQPPSISAMEVVRGFSQTAITISMPVECRLPQPVRSTAHPVLVSAHWQIVRQPAQPARPIGPLMKGNGTVFRRELTGNSTNVPRLIHGRSTTDRFPILTHYRTPQELPPYLLHRHKTLSSTSFFDDAHWPPPLPNTLLSSMFILLTGIPNACLPRMQEAFLFQPR
jgi:hypothetical protein